MGNQKLKWKAEEEEALLAGIRKYGPGKWKNILTDPEFSAALVNRTNIDLKDKWRNLTVGSGTQGAKDKSRIAKDKSVTVTPPGKCQDSASCCGLKDEAVDEFPNNTIDGKNALKFECNPLIFEAVSSIEDPNSCCDVSTIFNFIEQRHDVPQKFRRQLTARLRRLVAAGKLEKVQNSYRLTSDTLLGTKTSSPVQRCIKPKQSHSFGLTSVDSVEESTADMIADAENKSVLAAEAVNESEKLSKLVEEADAMLQLAKEIYEQCQQRGIVHLA